ncbi:uncharacterized protein LOC121801050 [Salvia splendens]|uniref:uncharacterized protein LOC121801050 n=1 Tax=Salvia splendens TaxID=180675 RepID=UPI001C2780AC|nr:uncharacterized protein LOC121801050 [Salvia splendens]
MWELFALTILPLNQDHQTKTTCPPLVTGHQVTTGLDRAHAKTLENLQAQTTVEVILALLDRMLLDHQALKLKCILIQQKVFKAVDGSLPDDTPQEKLDEMNELARAAIVLNLSDFVIRKIDHIESASEMWKHLDTLFTETSMSSRMHLLENLFKFKLDLSKDIDDNVHRFQKLVQNIKRSGDKTIDEYTSIALINVMPDSYSDVKAVIKYGRDFAPLDLIISSLKSKELELREMADDKNAFNKALIPLLGIGGAYSNSTLV